LLGEVIIFIFLVVFFALLWLWCCNEKTKPGDSVEREKKTPNPTYTVTKLKARREIRVVLCSCGVWDQGQGREITKARVSEIVCDVEDGGCSCVVW
jgi:hypothetical protein